MDATDKTWTDGYIAALREAHTIAANEADGDNASIDGVVATICQRIDEKLSAAITARRSS